MNDFLNDLTGGGFVDDSLAENKHEVKPLGLVVSEKAESGQAVQDEAERYLFLTDGGRTPFVIFEESDEDNYDEEAPVFSNAAEFKKAMGTLHTPSEAEAVAWSRELIAERLAQWDAAGLANHAAHRGDDVKKI
jgi:hypothetical protein